MQQKQIQQHPVEQQKKTEKQLKGIDTSITSANGEDSSEDEETQPPRDDSAGQSKDFDLEIEKGKQLICKLKDYVANSGDMEPRDVEGVVMIGHVCTSHETPELEMVSESSYITNHQVRLRWIKCISDCLLMMRLKLRLLLVGKIYVHSGV